MSIDPKVKVTDKLMFIRNIQVAQGTKSARIDIFYNKVYESQKERQVCIDRELVGT